jgi:hypothetical protein
MGMSIAELVESLLRLPDLEDLEPDAGPQHV